MSSFHIYCFCEHNHYKARTPEELTNLYFAFDYRDEPYDQVLESVKDFLAIQRTGYYEKPSFYRPMTRGDMLERKLSKRQKNYRLALQNS